MSKRSLSPQPLPPPKRVHTSLSELHHTSAPAQTFDTLFYDELILHIFSYLPFQDLCSIQATNRNWGRLALDNQLWKRLYMLEFGRSRLRGGKGFGHRYGEVSRHDGRAVRKLPIRTHPSKEMAAQDEEIKDWKWMFRISQNWATGRCEISQLYENPEGSLDPVSAAHQSGPERDLSGRMHMILSGPYTIFAPSDAAHSPHITLLNTASHQSHTITIIAASRPALSKVQITCLAVDQSPPLSPSPSPRLVVCLSNGELAIHTLSRRTHIYTPPVRSSRVAPIIQAAYHHPVLVTLSASFSVSVYEVSAVGPSLDLLHILSSFTSFPPTSLVLATPEPLVYKVVLTYATPVYPNHWSLGVCEVLLSSAPDIPSQPSSGNIRLVSTRSSRAFDLPPSFIDEEKLRAVREQWGRKVERIAAIQTDGRWVVLAPAYKEPAMSLPSNSVGPTNPARSSLPLQLYCVSFPPLPAPLKLTFIRSLHGLQNQVSGLAVADGRCVSQTVDGRVWVWDLEAGEGALAHDGGEKMEVDARKGSVVFDERRIVSAQSGSIIVSNFDV